MLYSDYTTALGGILQVPVTAAATSSPFSSTDWNNILPRIIEYAEQRIYRELDFLAQRTSDSSVNFTANNRTVTLPTQIVVLQDAFAITPVSTTPANGTRNRIRIVAKDVLDEMWPQETSASNSTGVPAYGALLSNTTMVVAPTPDSAYTLECQGIFRPAALSASNTSTYLSLNYPDLFLSASVVFSTAFQRDFGAQSDDPKMALSWEQTYQTQKKSAEDEAARQKGASTGWSAFSPQPLATPQRS